MNKNKNLNKMNNQIAILYDIKICKYMNNQMNLFFLNYYTLEFLVKPYRTKAIFFPKSTQNYHFCYVHPGKQKEFFFTEYLILV